MRARNLKPGLFKNEFLGAADPLLTILFEGLWCLADRDGRLEDRPVRIAAEVFPYRGSLDVNGYLTDLQRLGFVQRYSVGDLNLIQIKNFPKHQSPHHTERKGVLPAAVNSPSSSCGSPLLHGGNPPDLLIPDSLIPDSPAPASTKSQRPATFNSTEMARIVCEGLCLSGDRTWMIAKDSIDKAMAKWTLDAEAAGRRLIELWEEHQKAEGFKYPAKAFLEQGIWANGSGVSAPNVAKAAGSTRDRLARQRAIVEAEKGRQS